LTSGCLGPISERSGVAVSSPHFEILSTLHEDEAVEPGPEDPLNELDPWEYLDDRARLGASRQDRPRLIHEAREAYARSPEIADSVPETRAMLGRT
jgi:hypothetical protein